LHDVKSLTFYETKTLLGTRRFGRSKYENRDRDGNPDANAKTCPDNDANADVGHRRTDNCTEHDADEYAQRQSNYAPA
jgi:hypothetical protein